MLVVKLYEPKMVGTGQLKQLADMTGKAMLKDDINSIIEGKSYQMFVRSFQQLSLARSGSSVDEIDDIENDTADIDEDDEEHKRYNYRISRFPIVIKYTCIQCKRAMDVDESNIAICSLCKTTQRLTNPKLTAKR